MFRVCRSGTATGEHRFKYGTLITMCPHLQGGSTDPFAPECKIPLPVPYSPYDYWLEPTFIRRRNERERQRVRTVNDGFERLRSRLPLPPRDKDRRMSKVETLRYAISYIRHLQRLLGLIDDDDDDEDGENSRCQR
ncbi:achaete-scute homolog 4 [Rhipicephalus sanguineus]|uniref:achaete-scute homolog 4 n=1 Tax=Rhipicephalus sanguineus TaxID=34632 RepID=UPI0018946945|nr:achaete-scute homolog 4 [Rhipicephalus sanguineus]